jgi:hypothetical protein
VSSQAEATLDEVKAVSEFFWAEVRESLVNLKDVKVHLTNLGDFTVKHWLIDKELKKCEALAEQRKGSAPIGIQMAQRMTMLNQVKQMHQEEAQRKEFIYNHKKLTNENKQRKSSESLEK